MAIKLRRTFTGALSRN